MKKIIIAFALLIGIASFDSPIEAQNINISVNLGRQPAWGPTGYDYAGYYYFPDIDCYYDVDMSLFYYFDRGRWVSARYLPYAYRSYDLYSLYKVVLNMNDPWRYHRNHYRDYARYRGYHDQRIIRDSRDYRYHDSRRNRVAWYSRDRSQRDYDYDYNNYNYNNYNNRRDNNSYNYNRDYNYSERSYNRNDRYNNNNNYSRNSDRRIENNRREYNNSNNPRPGYRNEGVLKRDNGNRPNSGVRPSVNRDSEVRESRSTRSLSTRIDPQLASRERNNDRRR